MRPLVNDLLFGSTHIKLKPSIHGFIKEEPICLISISNGQLLVKFWSKTINETKRKFHELEI